MKKIVIKLLLLMLAVSSLLFVFSACGKSHEGACEYGLPRYTWRGETCIAYRVCKKSQKHVVKERGKVVCVEEEKATCVRPTYRTLEATFKNPIYTTRTRRFVYDDCITGHVRQNGYCDVCEDIELEMTLSASGEYYSVSGCGIFTGAELEIPTTYKGKPVKEIDCGVFYRSDDCQRNLKKVTIPEGVTRIGFKAFANCRNLESVALPSSLEILENETFLNCTNLQSITVPAGVTEMGYGVFSGLQNAPVYCEAECVTENWSWAWVRETPVVWDCNDNDVATDGNTYTTVNGVRYALQDGRAAVAVQQSGIITVEIAKEIVYKGTTFAVTHISDRAFSNLNVIKVIVPDSIQSIGVGAFEGCNALTIYCEKASAPSEWAVDWCFDSPVVWDYQNNDVATDGCIYTERDGVRYALQDGRAAVVAQSKNIRTADIPSQISVRQLTYPVTMIAEKAFLDCDLLSSVKIPDSVKTIGAGAFQGCSRLESVNIPSGIKKIEQSTFEGCSLLQTVLFPSSVTEIDDRAFAMCLQLDNVVFPKSVKSIGDEAFYNCESLSNITFYDGLQSIGNKAFYNFEFCDRLVIPKSVTYIGDEAFKNAKYTSLRVVFCQAKNQPEKWSNRWDRWVSAYWYKESKPTDKDRGNYWRYVDGFPRIWF